MFTIESKSGVRQSRVIQRLLAAGIIFGYAINQISVIYFFLLCDYRRSFWGGYDEE
ncbi:hypothetical protein MY652_07920 [Haemophilus influenzae]|uniref:Uncharacterized protein n=1 Tax=Haemophilus influenzae TaxID=727 RepID=A0A158SYZ2_HAEIF|nr:hypothetical protein [Haemophilus influenzae]KIS36086.1 hypothetical protein NTHI1209_01726 [Haemophilus influenzae]MCK8859000.1 hypothetical protein [Haemophilus influenzae]MCK8865878.1 hypothetical protein [Haemophilus influenzae]MCK8912925.1 hypothetical protein [Haemophilus influenzae]MCK9091196.1 hypothetical protein [Haemophilus influenzae]